jgi:hypothetical protein
MKRWMELTPAANMEPIKIHGRRPAVMRFYVGGPKGIVQFVGSTDWHKHLDDEKNPYRSLGHQRFECIVEQSTLGPSGWDLGYHSKKPMYEGHMKNECDLIKSGCYYDGSSLNAGPVFRMLVEQGSEAVFAYLEDYYKQVFDER